MPRIKPRERFTPLNGGRRYATYAQAADYIGCTKRTVQNMAEDGRLTVYRLGPRVVRVDLNEVDAVMASQIA